MASGSPRQLVLDPVPPADEAERAAACALSGLAGVGNQTLDLLRGAFGSLSRAVAAGGKALSEVEGLRADGAASLAAAGDLEKRGRWLIERAGQIGARVLLLGDPDYPTLLAQAAAPPPVLYVLGTLTGERLVSVVGARRVDDYGRDRTVAVVEHLAGAGIDVVSGGAEGVDGAAHRRALELGARTVAVLGTGLLNLYPATHRELFERIPSRGALVSEFALDGGGQRTHFPQRNRTLAGLSEAVVLTRGAANSGAISTAQAALRLGRPVFAVPGRVDEELAAAPNRLLAEGSARVTLDGREVLRALGLNTSGRAASPVRQLPADLSDKAKALCNALGPAPRHVDELAAECGLSTGETLAELLKLELSGLCTARPGKYFLRR